MRRLLLLLVLLLPCRSARAVPVLAPEDPCAAAIGVAERAWNLPPRLLGAIARVESGRPMAGAVIAWPWTINAEGEGHFFATREQAIAAVRDLQARGVRSIDVGCLQVNLMYHPQAFASLEDAFDPARNADAAARFLAGLKTAANGWLDAAGLYHSATPQLQAAYRARVAALWPGDSTAFAMARPLPLPSGPGAVMLGNGAERARLLPGSVAGRDLAAYRAIPVLRSRGRI